MRVLILGGTLFIGRRIARELLARGDDVMVVHRGQTEPAELSGCAHVHAARSALAEVAGQLRGFRPDAVIDTRAMTAADADAVLPHLPDAHLVLLSSIDVYRAYELLLAGHGGEPVPLTEQSPVRSERYPLRDLLPGLGEHYDKLDVEPLYLSRGQTPLVTVPEDLVPADLEDTRSIAQHFLVDSRKAATILGWRPSDPAETIPVSVRWHLANPPAEVDEDFSADDRALAAAAGS
jgi:hypothetical protein